MLRTSAGHPRDGRRLLAFALLAVLAVAAGGAQEATFADRVEVRRLLLEVRVLDRRGEPLPGLGPDDFVVAFDGEPVVVEAADRPGEELPYLQDGSPTRPRPLPGADRPLIVLFFQPITSEPCSRPPADDPRGAASSRVGPATTPRCSR